MEDCNSNARVQCALCAESVERQELEAHICTEHLDYFPYSCGHCRHYMTTAEMVRYHATRKAHLPVKFSCSDSPLTHKLDSEDAKSATETVSLTVMDYVTGKKEKPLQQPFICSGTLSERIKVEISDVTMGDDDTNYCQEIGVDKKSKDDSQVQIVSAVQGTCLICKIEVSPEEEAEHANGHIKSDALWTCNQCGFLGKSIEAVKFHVHKIHKGFPDDSRLYKKLLIPMETMLLMCFGTSNADETNVTEPEERMFGQEDAEQKICYICDVIVEPKDIAAHIQNHLDSRPLFGCAYCDFKAKRKGSVQAHITWKHEHGSRNAGIKDLNSVHFGFEQMRSVCFGSALIPQTSSDDDKNFKSALPGTSSCLPETKAVEFRKAHKMIKRNEKAAKHVTCAICRRGVRKQMVAAHIYSAHIQKTDTLKCQYCGFGVSYNSYRMKVHMKQKHPKMDPGNFTSSCPKMMDVYLEWRGKCFPEIGKFHIKDLEYRKTVIQDSDISLSSSEAGEQKEVCTSC